MFTSLLTNLRVNKNYLTTSPHLVSYKSFCTGRGKNIFFRVIYFLFQKAYCPELFQGSELTPISPFLVLFFWLRLYKKNYTGKLIIQQYGLKFNS